MKQPLQMGAQLWNGGVQSKKKKLWNGGGVERQRYAITKKFPQLKTGRLKRACT